MGTTPPHIARYLVVDDKFEDNDEEANHDVHTPDSSGRS
jgi:hypothetical protein